MQSLGPVCAFCSSITWAIGSSYYSKLSASYSPFAVNFGRALVALPLFVLAVFVVAGGWSSGLGLFRDAGWSNWGWLSLSMVASYGLGDTIFLWSSRYLGVPGALAIASCFPVWTALAGHLEGSQTLRASQAFGLLLTLAGVVMVILNAPQAVGSKNSTQKGKVGIGVLLSFLTSVMWATNGFAVAKGGADLTPEVGNVIRMLAALVLSFGFGRVFAAQESILMPRKVFIQGFWLFGLEAFLGSYFYFFGLSRSPLAWGATLASLAPVISVPVSLILKLEKFSIYRTLGVFFAVIGLGLLLGAFL